MERNHLEEDFANIGIGCCISDTSVMMESPREMEYKGEESKSSAIAPRLPSRRFLPRMMSSSLRRSSIELVASFTIKGNKSTHSQQGHGSDLDCVSAIDAAQLVAAEYFALGSEQGNQEFDELCTMHSLLDDDKEGDSVHNNSLNKKRGTTTTCSESESESHRSNLSTEDSLALEVGRSAHEYLEECFFTEVSVLDREKFNAIPEIVKSDLSIKRHLGKGSYSDVFEVVCNNGQLGVKMSNVTPDGTHLTNRRRPSRTRRAATFSSSINIATLARPPQYSERRRVLAMKCLRPQVRSDADQFTIGAEDLVHETAILANLSHPNIIKLHGRASGNLSDAFVLNDGYFILLDKLNETLQDRIDEWKRSSECALQRPTMNQIDVARTVAEATSYLHSKNILFRDLKPANVGFDSNGVLKLFDFGFAVGLPEKGKTNPAAFLFDKCGTPRYMAPEVGLSFGYSLPADVYSFGILLWEICSLEKPFSAINSSDEFERAVFMENKRPAIEEHWPTSTKELMRNCWSATPSERPTMVDVKSTLSLAMSNDADEKMTPKKPVVGFRMTRTRRISG